MRLALHASSTYGIPAVGKGFFQGRSWGHSISLNLFSVPVNDVNYSMCKFFWQLKNKQVGIFRAMHFLIFSEKLCSMEAVGKCGKYQATKNDKVQ